MHGQEHCGLCQVFNADRLIADRSCRALPLVGVPVVARPLPGLQVPVPLAAVVVAAAGTAVRLLPLPPALPLPAAAPAQDGDVWAGLGCAVAAQPDRRCHERTGGLSDLVLCQSSAGGMQMSLRARCTVKEIQLRTCPGRGGGGCPCGMSPALACPSPCPSPCHGPCPSRLPGGVPCKSRRSQANADSGSSPECPPLSGLHVVQLHGRPCWMVAVRSSLMAQRAPGANHG